jgi:hypothetical protein
MDLILDPASWPRWQPEIVATEGPDRLSPTDVVRGRATMLGFNVQGHSTAIDVAPDTFVEDVIVGVRMRVTYATAPSGEGTTITHRLVSDLPTGLWGRVLSFFLRSRLRRMQRAALDELVRQAEESCS